MCEKTTTYRNSKFAEKKDCVLYDGGNNKTVSLKLYAKATTVYEQ